MEILLLIVGIVFGLVGVMLFNLYRMPAPAEKGAQNAEETAALVQQVTVLRQENAVLKKEIEKLRGRSSS